MSKLIVEVCKVDKVKKHPNADKLEIVVVKGWQLVVPKGQVEEGAKVVYFPPDTILPVEVSDKFGVTKYLSKGRIKAIKLRGEPSYGLAVPVEDSKWAVGKDMASHYGATKYMPPVRVSAGDAEVDHPLFVEYTSIENMRHFPDVITKGEGVAVSEKVHGTNSRVGIIEGVVMAGSHRLRRKRPWTLTVFQKRLVFLLGKYPVFRKLPFKKLKEVWAHRNDTMDGNLYWFPATIPGVQRFLKEMHEKGHRQVIIYGEVFGPGVQKKFDYGVKNPEFRAFDIMVDGKYLDYSLFVTLCGLYEIPVVPIIGQMDFDIEEIKVLSGGKTTLNGSPHIREGVVVRPLKERRDEQVGRVILKYVSDEYLTKDKAEDEDFTEV